MLKDKLDKLANRQKGEELCLLGLAMSKMSEEDFASFVNVMRSDASATDIMEVLKQEGIGGFGMSHLREKRRLCFSDNQACFCLKTISEE
mgnify:CR=1 FL=1